jgi:2-aminoadipate transaminase
MTSAAASSITQFQPTPGVIDLAWGHPDPALLPVRELREAAERALDRYGPDVLAYGNAAGPPPLIDFICDRLQQTDGRAPSADEVVITSGASQGLDLVAALLLAPGDTVLVDLPTYHLAVHILRDHPVRLVGVRSDADGILVDDLARVVAEQRHQGERPTMLYTIPTFHNPTGRSLPDQRRADLVAFAADKELLVVEDDTYRELSYDGSSPPSLWALDRSARVIRLGSFAKSVAPGLRVGYVTAQSAIVARLANSGMLDSGGGTNHFGATVLAEYAAAGDYLRQIDRFRAAYRDRRNQVLSSLGDRMPDGTSWSQPGGGYFIWIQLPQRVTVTALEPAALDAGMAFLPAHVFYLEPGDAPEAIRLAFSMHPPAALDEAIARLAAATSSVLGGSAG